MTQGLHLSWLVFGVEFSWGWCLTGRLTADIATSSSGLPPSEVSGVQMVCVISQVNLMFTSLLFALLSRYVSHPCMPKYIPSTMFILIRNQPYWPTAAVVKSRLTEPWVRVLLYHKIPLCEWDSPAWSLVLKTKPNQSDDTDLQILLYFRKIIGLRLILCDMCKMNNEAVLLCWAYIHLHVLIALH